MQLPDISTPSDTTAAVVQHYITPIPFAVHRTCLNFRMEGQQIWFLLPLGDGWGEGHAG